MGAGGAHHRLLSSTTPTNASTFLPSYPVFLRSLLPTSLSSSLPLFISSSLPAFLPSYLPTTFLLPSYLPNQRFHSTTQSPTSATSQPTNNQVTVEEVTSLFSLGKGCG